MPALHLWTFRKVLSVSIGWVVLCVLLAILWLALNTHWAFGSGSGEIGAAVMVVPALMMAILIAPPLLLMIAWGIARWLVRRT